MERMASNLHQGQDMGLLETTDSKLRILGIVSADIGYLNRCVIVHRDISQENGLALVVDDEVAEVCDFGIWGQAEKTKTDTTHA